VTAVAHGGRFVAYGPSHWGVLVCTVLGMVVLVQLGRRAGPVTVRRVALVLGAVILVLNVIMQIWAIKPAHPLAGLPLQLSDMAPYAAVGALWTYRWWPAALTYYWGLVLSTQALVTPVLSAPDFPGIEFLAFFAIHVLVVWAAVFLAWGIGVRPTWRGYRFTVLVTVLWVGAMLLLNAYAGTNYGFVSAKPSTPSLLDLLGPWPWYLLPETVLVLGVWALLTVGWNRRSRDNERPP
jgi:hypothetical integral membrane protein (TIGR02206 family)